MCSTAVPLSDSVSLLFNSHSVPDPQVPPVCIPERQYRCLVNYSSTFSAKTLIVRDSASVSISLHILSLPRLALCPLALIRLSSPVCLSV